MAKDGRVEIQQYWDLKFAPRVQNGHNLAGELTDLLRDTVRGHLMSDVPIGVLLSGGVDSTAMLSFASEAGTNQIKSFTIGFEGAGALDERPFARMAAKQFGSEHYETTIAAEDFRDFWPRYVWHMEEPVCEPPAVALYYVSKLASQHVKVLLSGEGGDEAFAGYPEYRNFPLFEKIKGYLGPLRTPAGAAAGWASHFNRFRKLDKYSHLMQSPLQNYYLGRTALPASFGRLDSLYTPEFGGKTDGQPPWKYPSNCSAMSPIRVCSIKCSTWIPRPGCPTTC